MGTAYSARRQLFAASRPYLSLQLSAKYTVPPYTIQTQASRPNRGGPKELAGGGGNLLLTKPTFGERPLTVYYNFRRPVGLSF
jgi:hypothetical protein